MSRIISLEIGNGKRDRDPLWKRFKFKYKLNRLVCFGEKRFNKLKAFQPKADPPIFMAETKKKKAKIIKQTIPKQNLDIIYKSANLLDLSPEARTRRTPFYPQDENNLIDIPEY